MKFFKYFILLVTGLSLFISCKDKQVNESEVVKNTQAKTSNSSASIKQSKKTILCYGDSLTAGHGLEEKDAWPTLLQQRIDSLDMEYIVVNAGLSGETTSGGLNRLDWILKQKIDVFFLELGANDMLRGLDVSKTKENLDSIIIKVRSKHPGIPIVLAGMMSPTNMGEDYQKDFNKIFPELAAKHQAKLIPFFLDKVAGIKELNNADGIHPNAAGSKIILESVWTAMNDLL